MTPNQKGATVIFLICVAAFAFLWHEGYLDEWLATRRGPTPTGEWEGGTFSLTVAGRDTLDATATYTAGTDFTCSFYGYRGGTWTFLASEDGTGTNVESDPQDDGYIWLMTEEISTKYEYADTATTLAKNTYIIDYKWTDVDGDTDKEFVYKVSLWDIPEPASGYPARTYYLYYWAISNDGSYAAAEALQWETQPSDITGIGTSTVTKYIGWETKLCAEKQALGIYKIEIVVNTTDTTKFEIDKVNIPGIGYLDGSLLDEDIRSSDTKYQYIIGSDFDDIVYWKVPSGTNNKFDNTVAVKFTLASGDKLQFTLYLYEWLYDRTSVSDSDSVVCTQA